MIEPIDEVYFKWLYSKVASPEVPTPSNSYWTLMRDLHVTEFVWMLQGDDNRAADGLDLRREFLTQTYLDEEQPWMHIGCSVLEMLIAFSRHAEFQTDVSAKDWFWIFMTNLGLADLNDSRTRITEKVAVALDKFIWRTYDHRGRGGLFPLDHTANDQRRIELWYQFYEYLDDQQF